MPDTMNFVLEITRAAHAAPASEDGLRGEVGLYGRAGMNVKVQQTVLSVSNPIVMETSLY